MIKVIDIQNHITKRLKDKFPAYQVYVDDNREKMKTPCFSVSVRPLLTTGYIKHKNKLVNVDITYLSKNETKSENLAMSEELEDLFYLVLKVYDRKLYIEDLSIREVDTVLICSFTLDYNVKRGDLIHIDGVGGDENGSGNKNEGKVPDGDLGYTEGNIKYMKNLKLKDKEGNDY